MKCPHCGSKTRIRSSTTMSKLSKRNHRMCLNFFCGFTFITIEEAIAEVSPSAVADYTIRLGQNRLENISDD